MKRKAGAFLSPFLLRCSLLLFAVPFGLAADDYSDLVLSNVDEARSRLLIIDGNMYFHAGKDKNISFRVSEGSGIYFGKTNLATLPNSTQIRELQASLDRNSLSVQHFNDFYSTLRIDIDGNKRDIRDHNYEIAKLRANVTELESARRSMSRNNNRLRRLLSSVNSNLLKLRKQLTVDNCLSQPCKNGATCINLVGKYMCMCPSHFEGTNCESRIDECALYADTGIGCQNGGNCTNNVKTAGFTCKCPKGYHGRRCQTKSSSCDYELDLCGEHGHCVPSKKANGDESYKCLCEIGFRQTNDPENPTCEDIDECAQTPGPCYPEAGCVNTPGGFRCTSCPAGLHGNGIHCFDFDECAQDQTNECSKNPPVECLNTFGSYKCGSCPTGYEGDGRTCKFIRSGCASAPCHPKATCNDEPYVTCQCPDGWIGDGFGADGCELNTTSSDRNCQLHGCRNGGTCMSNGTCTCHPAFSGALCENKDLCASSNCGQNGYCKVMGSVPRCFCNPGFYGSKCQNQEDSCGFHSNEESGVIAFNRSSKELELRDITCQWSIQLYDTNKILEFRFHNFTIPKLYSVTSKSCRFGFANLTFLDGLSPDSPKIGGFCHGDHLTPDMNEPFYTSGNAARIKFQLRLHAGTTNVKLTWKAVNPRCGGRRRSAYGDLTYYDVHDEDLCAWYISVPAKYHLEVKVQTVKMATGNVVNCSVNALELYDHQSAANRTKILEVCETQSSPLVFRTTVPYLTVYFRTDRKAMGTPRAVADCSKDKESPWCGVGFTLSWTPVELPAGCGGDFYPDASGQMSGVIESPNYAHGYFPNLNCEWNLHALPQNSSTPDEGSEFAAQKVRIEFLDFDLATAEVQYATFLSRIGDRIIRGCTGDMLRVMPRGGIFCNANPPKGVYTNPNFNIRLMTDATVSGKGFRFKYETICELDFRERNGTVTSPNYPGGSNTPFRCSYRIIAQPKQAIRLVFRHIGLKTDINTCFYDLKRQKEMGDYIELSGGHPSNEQINRRYVCARYPFVAPNGEVIVSGVRPLKITYSSTGNALTNSGFAFDYEIFDVGCGGTYFASTGVITSPNYPQRYHPHMYCIYEVSVPYNQRVRLNFDVFDLENVANQDDCGFDSVQVFDGTYVNEDTHGKLLGLFCGLSIPPTLMSSGNKMALVFLSDRSVNGAGFSATYRAVNAADDCDQTFTDLNGIIEFNSTLHPRATKCTYIITLPRMHRIALTFENISIPCSSGQLSIRNGMTEQSPTFPGHSELCDDSRIARLITQGNRAFLRLTTDSPALTFFRVKYEQFAAGCGGKVTGVSGFISAPQYPMKDSRSLNCEWSVSVAAGNRVRLSFPFIDNLDSASTNGDCSNFGANYIDVSDGSFADAVLLKRYCSQQTSTPPIISSGNQLSVKYLQHGGSYYGSLFGFLGHYATECKDIVLTDFHGSVQSPGFPGPINPKEPVTCKWTIRTTPGTRIRVMFHRFKLETAFMGMKCFSHLSFKESEIRVHAFSGELRYPSFRFCEDYHPQEIISKSNELTVEYKSDRANRENVFWFSYTTMGCGGVILLNNTEIVVRSSDFVADAVERECAWSIRAPIGLVRIHVERGFFLGRTGDMQPCDDPLHTPDPEKHDGIAFFAGRSNASGIAQKIMCGVVSDTTWTSHSNEVYAFLRLSKANTMNLDGVIFKATVHFVPLDLDKDVDCGGVIDVDPFVPQILHSPNYPNMYPQGIQCIWQINARNGYAIGFNITEFNNPATAKRYATRTFLADRSVSENCSLSLAFLEGSLAFYEGTYKPSENYVRSQRLMYRVCLEQPSYQVLTTTAEAATVIFHGSPQPFTDTESDKKPGFVMKVFARCGGTLKAKQRSQSFGFVNTGDPAGDTTSCEYKIVKDDSVEDDGDQIFVHIQRRYFSDQKTTGIAADRFDFQCGVESKFVLMQNEQDHYVDYNVDQCGAGLVMKVLKSPTPSKYLVTYGLQSKFCGGWVSQPTRHIVYEIHKERPADCEWSYLAPPGFAVMLVITYPRLPTSELCQDSFVEVRSPSFEKPVPRVCNATFNAYRVANGTIRLRYRVPQDDDEWDVVVRPVLDIHSTIVHLEELEGDRIDMPPFRITDDDSFDWKILAKDPNNKIKVTIEKMHIPPFSDGNTSLVLDGGCVQNLCHKEQLEGFIEPSQDPRVIFFDSAEVKVSFRRSDTTPYFSLHWEEISEAVYDVGQNPTVVPDSASDFFLCGGELVASYEPQVLTNPVDANGLYESSLRCRWHIKRPRFSNVYVKIVSVDVEPHPACRYDFLALNEFRFTPADLVTRPAGLFVFCNDTKESAAAPKILEFTHGVYVYFMSDRSRNFRGFKLEYYLGCHSVDVIPIGPPLDAFLSSPSYPVARANESCMYSVLLASNRWLKATVELDLGGTDGQCTNEYLLVASSPSYTTPFTTITKRCGQVSFEHTFEARVHIYYFTEKAAHHKGFRMHLLEVVHDCSATDLFVDEFTPRKLLTSPEFPSMSPNSLDCHWTLHASPGHRLQFTVDPHTFNLQNSDDECVDDYLEIHDGPSAAAPLLGKYCSVYAPDTIFSSDSSLYVHYVTDSFAKSAGFNASYEIATCGGSLVLRPGLNASVASPNFPDVYPQNSQCGWSVKAPPGHFVHANIEHIWMSYSDNCSQDYVQLRSGNASGEIMTPRFCSRMGLDSEGYDSSQNSMFVEFKANTSTRMARTFCLNRMCGFEMSVSPSKYFCGGTVQDDEGTIVLPGFPDQIPPHMSCQWQFKAGIGNRYVVDFTFIDDNGFYFDQVSDHCYPDLEVFNGPPDVQHNLQVRHRRFCSNQTTFVSTTDLATLMYSDHSNRYLAGEVTPRIIMKDRAFKPWKITYRKVQDRFNREGCSLQVNKNVVMRVGNMTIERGANLGIGARSFCHLRMVRPMASNVGTTMLRFTDMNVRTSIVRACSGGNRVVVQDGGTGPWPVNQVVCNQTGSVNETVLVYPNQVIDVFVVNNPFRVFFDNPLEFKLAVNFYKCGGTLTADEDQSGIITSPNFGDNNVYTKNEFCLWYLKAPEDMIVELEFDFMDIEHHVECNHDSLEVAEGAGTHSVIHRYCYSATDPLPDRLRKIRSRGRELTLIWRTDSGIQRKGFNATWHFDQFHEEGDKVCGFTSHAMHGEIVTPNFPRDYPNDLQCIWDIVVPYGYHVQLTFQHFDIQLSRNCEKDSFQVSQEHQSRALAPLGDYYFYFEHEEKLPAICGNEAVPAFVAESNRIRVNFTTDSTISGRGFQVEWRAACGSTMTLTHGVITSPHYPSYFPNKDMECNYLIFPALPEQGVPIVTLKVLDFDFPGDPMSLHLASRASSDLSQTCNQNYLEIIDVSAKRTLMKLCAENMGGDAEAPAVSVKGGIGVRFVTNQTYFEDDHPHRGFKLSYAVANCGGELHLADTRDRISGTITSPGFPLPYHHGLDCVWNVTAPSDRIISIKFVAIEMEENGHSCAFDFVELYDGIHTNFTGWQNPENYTTKLMGRYCGQAAPTNYLVTSGNNLTVRFRSDQSNNAGGFKMVVTATLGPASGCGGALRARKEWQTLTPPLDARGKYFNGLRCMWNVKGEGIGVMVEFKFTQMHLETRRKVGTDNVLVSENATSCYDFVAIYDGPRSISSFLMPPTCSVDDLPLVFQSTYSKADFYFESDSADSYDGFSVDYRAIDSDCGGTFHASPNPSELAYESEFAPTRTNQRHKRCRWFFVSTAGQPLMLDFRHFKFPSTDPTCPFEYLEIRDVGVRSLCKHPACGGAHDPFTNVRFCGSHPPPKFISTTSIVSVTTSFLLTSEFTAMFNIVYQTLDQCNRTISIEDGSPMASGRLTSPNYPNSYDDNATCITRLTAPEGFQIFLVFNQFRLERGDRERHRFRLPGYRSGWRRFNMYRNSDLGGPDDSYFGRRETCSYDYLTITEQKNGTQKFCGYSLPPPLLSTSNKYVLTLATDATMNHAGYDLSYYTVKKSPRRSPTSFDFYEFAPNYERSGVIAPIGYPRKYPKNTVQRFTIRPPSALFCKFSVVVLQMSNEEGRTDCRSADNVKWASFPVSSNLTPDGDSVEWRQLGCSMSENEENSQKEQGLGYYLEFSSDQSDENNGNGFRVTWMCDDYNDIDI